MLTSFYGTIEATPIKGKDMKKFFTLFITVFICFHYSSVALADGFDAAAKNAIAFDSNTGKILYEKEADTPVPIGSLSKLLTAYLVYDAIQAEKITMDSPVDISDYPLNLTTNYDISNLPLDKGRYTVEELLEASLIANANSATISLAEKIAGSEKKFVDMMKNKLKEWGITNAKIVNSTGLNNSYLGDHIYPGSKKDDENQLSAYALAIISYHLLEDFPQVLNITEKTSFMFDGLEVQTSNYMLKDMPSYRKGVNGLKTGASDQGGVSFIASAKEGEMRLITIVLNVENAAEDIKARFSATANIMDYIANNFVVTTLAEQGKPYENSSIAVINGNEDKINAIATKDLKIIQRIGSDLEPKVTFKTYKSNYKAPLAARTPIGTLSYKDTDLIGKGYLEKEPSVVMQSEKEVSMGFFLKVWWHDFVEFVNEKL